MAKVKNLYSISALMEILTDLYQDHTSVQIGDVYTPTANGKITASVIAGLGEEKFYLHTPNFKWLCKKLSGNVIRIEGGKTVQPYFDRLDAKHKR